jgi:hypothetical protein
MRCIEIMLKTLLRSLSLLLVLAGYCGAADGPLVLFDEGHGQQFVAGGDRPLDLSQLAAVFRDQGSLVRSHAGPLNDAALSGVSALVIAGPFVAFSADEIIAVSHFVEAGGALAVMLHIGPPLGELLHAFGIDFSNGVIREHDEIIDGEPLNFQVSRLSGHPLFDGLDRFELYGGWALVNFDERSLVVASTGPRAWVDLNGDKLPSPGDAIQSFGVVVAGQAGAGRFVVFGDDGLLQNRFLGAHNRKLAGNLGRWLTAK